VAWVPPDPVPLTPALVTIRCGRGLGQEIGSERGWGLLCLWWEFASVGAPSPTFMSLCFPCAIFIFTLCQQVASLSPGLPDLYQLNLSCLQICGLTTSNFRKVLKVRVHPCLPGHAYQIHVLPFFLLCLHLLNAECFYII
jgi:hypothetical protein